MSDQTTPPTSRYAKYRASLGSEISSVRLGVEDVDEGESATTSSSIIPPLGSFPTATDAQAIGAIQEGDEEAPSLRSSSPSSATSTEYQNVDMDRILAYDETVVEESSTTADYNEGGLVAAFVIPSQPTQQTGESSSDVSAASSPDSDVSKSLSEQLAIGNIVDPLLTPESTPPSTSPRASQTIASKPDTVSSSSNKLLSSKASSDALRNAAPEHDEDTSWSEVYASANAGPTSLKPPKSPEIKRREEGRRIYFMLVQPAMVVFFLAWTDEERKERNESRNPNRPTVAPSTVTPVPTIISTPTFSPITRAPFPDDGVDESQPEFQYLLNLSFDGGDALQTPGSPQRKAYIWLSEDLSTSSNRRLTISYNDRLLQRYSLATIYYATNPDDAVSWTRTTGWLVAPDECAWYARHTGGGFADVDDDDTVCNDDGYYVSLSLSYNGLQGQLPLEIGHMTQLKSLHLSGNKLTGTLPTSLTELTSLQLFLGADNLFTGNLPSTNPGSSTSFWRDLRIWNLQDNMLSGSISDSLLQGMTQLSMWIMQRNQFSGQLPSSAMLGLSESLIYVDLGENQFTGPLPTEWGSLTNLVTLELGNNQLTSLPESLVQATNLHTLWVPFNQLKGPLVLDTEEGSSGGLKFLVDLDISFNQLTGSLPKLTDTTQLRDLELGHNQFVGDIPTTYGLLTDLMILDLQSNQLSGNIPSTLNTLTLLSEIRLDGNNLTGSVPDSVCVMFQNEFVTFYSDCRENNGPPEIDCIPGTCCTYCCADGLGCKCAFEDVGLGYLC